MVLSLWVIQMTLMTRKLVIWRCLDAIMRENVLQVPDGDFGCVTYGCIVSHSKCIFVSLAGTIFIQLCRVFQVQVKHTGI